MPVTDRQQIDQLAARIRRGEYRVDPHAVAGAIVDRLLTGIPR